MPARIAQLPRKLISTVGAGFGLALSLIVALAMVGLHQLASTNAHLESIVGENSVKARLANSMRDILRDRAIAMLSIVVSRDAFEKDQEMLQFYRYGGAYQQVRLELDPLIRLPEEREVLARIDGLTRANQPVMVRIVDLAVEGYTFLAFDELQREGIPLQRQLVKELDSLIQIQRDMTAAAAAAARADYARTRWLMIGLGLVAVLAAIVVAITVMRRAARLAAASERERTKFLTLFETNSDGIVILDRHGFSDCNPATLEMFHMDRVEDFLGRRPDELGVEDQPCGTPPTLLAERHIREAMEKGHAFFRWTARRPDGSTFPAEIALHSMTLDGEPVIQAIMRDVSTQREAEAALEAARDAAVAATEMKSQFVANVSHEIRTPMNGILGMTHLLLNSALTPRQHDHAQTIADSAKALMGMINDLLDFSKIEAGRLSVEHIPFDLRPLLRAALQLYRHRAESKGLALDLEVDAAVPDWVRGDPTRLRQVLLNLLDNALKFTHAGQVRLSVDAIAGKPGWLRFSVRDSGIGMSAEARGRVFEAFSQADGSVTRKYGGTGLGLAICRQLAALMGGELTLDSEEGKGSTFHLSLPLPAAPAATPATAEVNAAGLRFPGTCILVAEDNPVNRKLLGFMLEDLGVTVAQVEDGKAAYERLAEGGVDLVLMDWQMPVWDGLTATRAIRDREAREGRARLPVIALTANVMPGFAETCREAGMDDYLSKPLQTEELARALARQLPGRAAAADLGAAPASQETADVAPSRRFDLEKLRRVCQGDAHKLREMLELFVSSSESLLAALTDALVGRDGAQAARQAHQLKGAAAYLGAAELTALAAEVENLAKAEAWEACATTVDDLEAAFIALRLEIGQYAD
ncbi:MAG: multi-sensor hybrid histidine kinase [bacterium]|nr:MAG: multi-sensor hybrid histidine kinase [bacterium]KAF0148830.1 MAG: multi-sensor hybrid histidine kinase [bacterium]KAF0167309.1 MAG: multi-sensor hybrid histidine kinase [bacterium]